MYIYIYIYCSTEFVLTMELLIKVVTVYSDD